MFKRVLAVISSRLVVTANTLAQEAPAQEVVVRKGTVLKLSTLQPLDSATARPGDEVSLRLSRPLVVNGVTLLREGSCCTAGSHMLGPQGPPGSSDCTTPRTEFYLPAQSTVGVVIVRSHHVRF